MSVTVWWAPLEAVPRAHEELLDAAERARVARFRQPADRSRSLLAAALLRLAVEDRTGTPARDVAVVRRCPACGEPHGKPTLPGTGTFVSVSHSGDWIAVAITEAGDVGVDVERVVGLEVASLAATALDRTEATAVRTPRDFLVYWTRKEAVLKATGDGLTVAPKQVIVRGSPGDPSLVAYPGRPDITASLVDLSPDDAHVGALAVLAAGPVTVEERPARDLLYG